MSLNYASARVLGDVVVDTFPLPSACVCHFRESPLTSDLTARDGLAAAVLGKAAGKGRDVSVSVTPPADDRCEETESKLDAIVTATARTRSGRNELT